MLRTIIRWGLALPFLVACTEWTPRVSKGLFTEPYPGLPVQVDTLFVADEASDHYCNGAVPVYWKGKLFCMWQSSAIDEDSPDTHVVYAEPGGPVRPLPRIEGVACSSGGWIAREDSLIALVNSWTDPPSVCYSASADGQEWSPLRPVLQADGTPLHAIMEQDPCFLPGGRLLGAAHFPPGLQVCPVYTDDPSGVKDWKRAVFTCENLGDQSRALEPSLYIRADGAVVLLLRDQSSTYRKLVSVSKDKGEHWGPLAVTDLPDSRSKQCAGNLPDGRIYTVGNLFPRKDRSALHIALSPDGFLFNELYELLHARDLPPRRYEGRAKTLGYSYPKACMAGDTLVIGCSLNKEAILLLRCPLP